MFYYDKTHLIQNIDGSVNDTLSEIFKHACIKIVIQEHHFFTRSHNKKIDDLGGILTKSIKYVKKHYFY